MTQPRIFAATLCILVLFAGCDAANFDKSSSNTENADLSAAADEVGIPVAELEALADEIDAELSAGFGEGAVATRADAIDPSVLSEAAFNEQTNQEALGKHRRPFWFRHAGAVYTMSNGADGNTVLAYGRSATGRLTRAREFATGGLGTGDGLNGTSNPLVLTSDKRYLLVVNGGDNTVSVFRRIGRNLRLIDTVPSGGERPVSITTHGSVAYVLNVGGTSEPNITGFKLNRGRLSEIVTQPVNAGAADLPQIKFSPDGRFLVVTDKPSDTITTYVVDRHGVAGEPNAQVSAGPTPFGFSISRDNILLVSEAAGGAADASSASSYRIHRDGSLETVSAVIPTTETAACWVEFTRNGRYGYTTNGPTSTISGFAVDYSGAITLLDADGETGSVGDGGVALDIEIVGNYLMYVHAAGTNELRGFFVNPWTGALWSLNYAIAVGLPAAAVGVAAF